MYLGHVLVFKDIFGFENYFDISEFHDIYTLFEVRFINHKLSIEIGRWTNIQRERRVTQKILEMSFSVNRFRKKIHMF